MLIRYWLITMRSPGIAHACAGTMKLPAIRASRSSSLAREAVRSVDRAVQRRARSTTSRRVVGSTARRLRPRPPRGSGPSRRPSRSAAFDAAIPRFPRRKILGCSSATTSVFESARSGRERAGGGAGVECCGSGAVVEKVGACQRVHGLEIIRVPYHRRVDDLQINVDLVPAHEAQNARQHDVRVGAAKRPVEFKRQGRAHRFLVQIKRNTAALQSELSR